MNAEHKERPGIFPFPPAIYLAPLLIGLVIHFAFPLRLLPLGWLQFAVGLPIIGISLVIFVSAVLTLLRRPEDSNPQAKPLRYSHTAWCAAPVGVSLPPIHTD